MKYRTLGNSEVSILGFGCMRMPIVDGDYSKINEEEAMKQIRYAIDNGVNYLDTAWPYHSGNSEAFVGKVIKDGYREKVHIATKLPSWLIKSRDDMDKYLDLQLENLGVEQIDYYLLHALNRRFWDNLCRHDVFDFIKKAQESGKIKYIGFSFHDDYPLFEEIIKAYDWDFCQIQLNYYDEEYQAGVKGLKLAGELGIGVIIMEPLRGGRLAEQGPGEIQKIWAEADEPHTSVDWALRYLWNYPEVKLILSGMNNLDHIKENIAIASNVEADILTEKEKGLIKRVKSVYKARIQVDCTYCKYCLPCPQGVVIPACFEYYNDAFVFENKEHLKNRYLNELRPEMRADKCVQCGECESKCPQNISIIEELVNVAEFFKE